MAGIQRLLEQPSLLLADEMGLGKTIQAIAALRVLKARSALNSALVVAPAGLILQWRRQLRLWAPELRPSTVIGNVNERVRAWHEVADVHLVGYETLKADISLAAGSASNSRRWDVVVLDEAQRIKAPESETARAVKRLTRERSWALTGTPLENRLDDLISILDFVVPGRFRPAEMAAGLRRVLAEVQLRRRRAEVLPDLPPKYADTVHLDLGRRQRASYARAEQDGLYRLGELGSDLRITHVLDLIVRLKQICNFCPETGESAKLGDLRRRLEAVVAGGEKAIVFSQFVEHPFGLRRLASLLSTFEPLVLSGDMNPQDRSAAIARFESNPRHRVLLLSLKAGGVGLNLTAASHVFHFDRWWNPAVEAQAEDRTHRIGQDRAVNVHAYLCVDTIEERIQEILSEKRALFADVIDGVDARRLRRLDLDALLRAVTPAA